MSEKLVTKGIVLRATATKEADYILNILTDSLGRIAVVARGARRKGSRIAAGSELLAFSELVLYQRGNWYYLDEASTISLFDGIRQDIELLSLASYFAEMTECVTAEDEPVPEILSLLLNSLYALDTLQKPQSIVKAAFELKLLALSGYEPLLDGCAVCGTHNPKEPVFDAQQGVLLCRECAGHGGGGLLPRCPHTRPSAAGRGLVRGDAPCAVFRAEADAVVLPLGRDGKALCRGLRGVCAGAA